jgi:hypothetical protein
VELAGPVDGRQRREAQQVQHRGGEAAGGDGRDPGAAGPLVLLVDVGGGGRLEAGVEVVDAREQRGLEPDAAPGA